MYQRGEKVKQCYFHYAEWEDYQNGMYSDCSVSEYEKAVKLSMDLLSNNSVFKSSIKKMFEKWVKSTKENLTNNDINKRAWVGQATCCFNHSSNEKATREAWGLLNEKTRDMANNVAEECINEWIKTNGDKDEQQTLFKH